MQSVGEQSTQVREKNEASAITGTGPYGQITVDAEKFNKYNSSSQVQLSAHSHVTGLGVGPDGVPLPCANGLVGQIEAREAASLVVELVREKMLSGKALLLAGPVGTGKTAIATGIAAELGKAIPFSHLSGSAVYSAEVKKSEIIQEHLRRAIRIRIKEVKEVYEGEVTEITAEEVDNPLGGYGKCMSALIVGLRTTQGTKTLRLAPQLNEAMQKEKIDVGDVIYIETGAGVVKRCGRCDRFASEFDLEYEEYVPLPKGDVHKQKEVVQDISLHDLDLANAKPTGGTDLASILGQYIKPKKTEITDKLRNEVNKMVDQYIENGIAVITPGVLFIDEVHMLDAECFAFLNRAMENPVSPIIVLASNRGVSMVKGSGELSPHGIPLDLLDRSLIARTVPFSPTEIIQIISIRAKCQNANLTPQALAKLGEIGTKTSLRFALQLIEPAWHISQIDQCDAIDEAHVSRADNLFLDAKASATRIAAHPAAFAL